jgi:hypothetical protein
MESGGFFPLQKNIRRKKGGWKGNFEKIGKKGGNERDSPYRSPGEKERKGLSPMALSQLTKQASRRQRKINASSALSI